MSSISISSKDKEDCDVENFDVWKEYPFIKGQVPRYDFKDPVGLKLIQDQSPVILTGSDLVSPAMKWDLEYLQEHLGPGPFAVFCHRLDTNDQYSCSKSTSKTTSSAPMNVSVNVNVSDPQPHLDPLTSGSGVQNQNQNGYGDGDGGSVSLKKAKTSTSTRLNIFKYFDDKKLQALQDKSVFQQDIAREEMTFPEFLAKYRGDRSKERVYLQQPLNNTVGRQIAADFVGFNWPWAMEKQKEWGWGPLTSNLLLIGERGNVTPCHYDEQQNLFCQLIGSKRFLLFSPDNFRCLYSYPVHHPHDRQSQVDLDSADLSRFPNFCDVQGIEAKVNPGDILYIPMYWWHHVINLEDTIAINFWHKAGPNTQIEYPLKSRQKVAMIRNVEKMLLEALQDQQELSNVLHWLVDGRF